MENFAMPKSSYTELNIRENYSLHCIRLMTENCVKNMSSSKNCWKTLSVRESRWRNKWRNSYKSAEISWLKLALVNWKEKKSPRYWRSLRKRRNGWRNPNVACSSRCETCCKLWWRPSLNFYFWSANNKCRAARSASCGRSWGACKTTWATRALATPRCAPNATKNSRAWTINKNLIIKQKKRKSEFWMKFKNVLSK